MKISSSLNTVILLSALGFLAGIIRLMMDVRFVPEVYEAMPPDQPVQTALVMLLFVAIFGGWLWALLSASNNYRRGLIALLNYNALIVLAWSTGTLIAFCPTPCPVIPPLTDIVTWATVIIGLIATIATMLYLRSSSVTS